MGVFATKSSVNGEPEYRIKMIKEDSITSMSYGSTNDWSTSDVKTVLQNYAQGLTSEDYYVWDTLDSTSISLIDDAVWYTGAVDHYKFADMYADERTSTWVGKVGLINPSDYQFAHNVFDENGYLEYDCLRSWDYNWTMNPGTFDSTTSMMVAKKGSLLDSAECESYYCNYTENLGVNPDYFVHPVVYLKADVKILSGDGTSNNRYEFGYTS